VSAAYTKIKNAFKSFESIRIKIPFVKNYKDCTICAILRKNTLFCLAATEAETSCAMLRRGPKIMQIPLENQGNKDCSLIPKRYVLYFWASPQHSAA